jgi:hypothetical protein
MAVHPVGARSGYLAQIRAELSRLRAASPSLASKGVIEKVYEIYVLTCLLKALRSIGAVLEPRDLNDVRTNNLRFRFNPGKIHSPTVPTTFINVTCLGRQYEVQNGVRVRGRSYVLHELDVCIIDKDEAVKCRALQVDPSQSKIHALIECKFYGDKLTLGLGREFIGLHSEFNTAVKAIVSNTSHDEMPKLLRTHKAMPLFDIRPSNPTREQELIGWFSNELRRRFHIP